MRVIVTGGNGFIGQYVVRELEAQGHKATIVDRPRDVKYINSYYKIWSPSAIDAVIHLAGQLGTAELFDTNRFDEAVDVNIKGTQRVLELCREKRARFIGITMPDVWANVYQGTKKCAKILATAWHESFGVPVTHIRTFNAYGIGQKYGPGHPQKIIPTFSTLAWNNEPISIWGDGTQTVDLVSASDVASVLVQALEAPGEDETFDAGSGIDWSVNQVAEFVRTVCGSQSPLQWHPMRAGEREHTHLRAQGEGWNLLSKLPKFDSDELVRTIRSYKP